MMMRHQSKTTWRYQNADLNTIAGRNAELAAVQQRYDAGWFDMWRTDKCVTRVGSVDILHVLGFYQDTQFVVGSVLLICFPCSNRIGPDRLPFSTLRPIINISISITNTNNININSSTIWVMIRTKATDQSFLIHPTNKTDKVRIESKTS